MKECHVYIETSIKWPKQGNGIVGIIFTDVSDTYSKTLFGQVRDSTEHAAVLIGINRALEYLGSYESIHIHTTSNVGHSFKYLGTWKKNGFLNSKGKEVKHADLWKEIAEKTNEKKIEIHMNEFNGYRNWLCNECNIRGRKHGYVL